VVNLSTLFLPFRRHENLKGHTDRVCALLELSSLHTKHAQWIKAFCTFPLKAGKDQWFLLVFHGFSLGSSTLWLIPISFTFSKRCRASWTSPVLSNHNFSLCFGEYCLDGFDNCGTCYFPSQENVGIDRYCGVLMFLVVITIGVENRFQFWNSL